MRVSWTLHTLWEPVPPLLLKQLWPAPKDDLSPVRLIPFFALVVLVAVLVPPHARFLASRAARPLVTAGQQSLEIFCLGILLSALAHVLINEFGYGLGLRLAVNALGIAIMLVAAQVLDWYKALDRMPAQRPSDGAGREERRNEAAPAAPVRLGGVWRGVGRCLPDGAGDGGRQRRGRAEQDGAERPACAVPPEIVETVPSLPHLAAAIRRDKPVRIVVIGGGSTKGAAAGAPENAYPQPLAGGAAEAFSECRRSRSSIRACRGRPRARWFGASRPRCPTTSRP